MFKRDCCYIFLLNYYRIFDVNVALTLCTIHGSAREEGSTKLAKAWLCAVMHNSFEHDEPKLTICCGFPRCLRFRSFCSNALILVYWRVWVNLSPDWSAMYACMHADLCVCVLLFNLWAFFLLMQLYCLSLICYFWFFFAFIHSFCGKMVNCKNFE